VQVPHHTPIMKTIEIHKQKVCLYSTTTQTNKQTTKNTKQVR